MKTSFSHIIIFTLIVFFISMPAKAQKLGFGPTSLHTIVVNRSGTVYTWGYNFYGQLGNGNTGTNSNVPVAVNTLGVLSGKTITQVATGANHCIVLASDGTVYTWGYNANGQLGNGNNTNSNVPVAANTSGVLSGKTITQVAAGYNHSIALASDGTVYTWGDNTYGQFGNGNNTNSNVPVAVYTSGVLSGKTITQVAAGANHCIVLASDGTVYTWGYNYNGELGNGNNTNSNVPVAVNTLGVLSGKTITQVAAANHCIVLASDGTVYTWGYNFDGELGNGNNTSSNVPVAVYTSGVLSSKTITQVAGSDLNNIALASDGTVYTWGENSNGQLGNGNTGTNSNVPVAVYTSGVLSGKTITQVAAGSYHSIALASDGTVYTWGDNTYGELGNGNNTNNNVPVAVYQSTMGALPVELNLFTANNLGDKIELKWNTATEVNNYGFEIQRSAYSGQRLVGWEKIGFVAGAGNSNSPKSYTFTDQPTGGTSFSYRLKQIDNDGGFKYYDAITVTLSLSTKAELMQNSPNPFNPSTIIKFSIPSVETRHASSLHAVLRVYDLLGREIATLVNEEKAPGNYEVKFSAEGGGATNLPSGVYFYTLHAGNYTETKKMLLMK